jgi:hypothetical protein
MIGITIEDEFDALPIAVRRKVRAISGFLINVNVFGHSVHVSRDALERPRSLEMSKVTADGAVLF